MNILVINGSPSGDKSTTMILTRAFLEGMGETAEVVNTIDINANPCKACYACWVATDGHCVQNDKAIAVLEKMRKADLIIWSIPLFAYGAPSHCKALMDRTLCFNKAEMYIGEDGRAHHYGYEDGSKKTVLISTAGFPDVDGNFVGLKFQIRHMYGQNTPAICCAESSLLMNDAVKHLMKGYLENVKKAGREYKESLKISEDTQKVLDSLVIPAEDYIDYIAKLFKGFREGITC